MNSPTESSTAERTIQDAYAEFRDELVAAGVLIPLGPRGVFGRSGAFEDVIQKFERQISRVGADSVGPGSDAEVMRFPPVFSRGHYCSLSHIHNFPDLMGSVHSFTGADREHKEMIRKFQGGEEWTEDLTPSEVMLLPAACYPLYPTARGVLAEAGRTVDLQAYVFRHEPSDDPARMQIFRQREFVRLGSAEQALAHRDAWLARSKALLEAVGLQVEAVVANDPFFGRGGKLAKASQLEQALKYELVVPICSTEKPTAVASSNYHREYFGVTFGIITPDGEPAHTACVGFGLERVALALFKAHGLDPRAWPASVRAQLERT